MTLPPNNPWVFSSKMGVYHLQEVRYLSNGSPCSTETMDFGRKSRFGSFCCCPLIPRTHCEEKHPKRNTLWFQAGSTPTATMASTRTFVSLAAGSMEFLVF